MHFRAFIAFGLLGLAPLLVLYPTWIRGATETSESTTEKTVEVDELDARLNRELTDTIRPILQQHCGDCHMGDANEAGVNIEDYLSIDKIREHTSTWAQIRGVIRADAMPPPDSSEISPEERKQLVDWIESALYDIDCNCEIKTPVVTLRRLNQVEYDNTVRDLLQLPDVKPSKDFGFVSDDVGNGFDNQGEVLTLPPIVMEKYLQAAEYLAGKSVVANPESIRTQRFDGIRMPIGETFRVPVTLAGGDYSVSLRMRFGDGQPDRCYAIIRVNGETHREYDISTRNDTYRFETTLREGENEISIEYLTDQDPSRPFDAKRRLYIEWVETEGPHKGQPMFPAEHQAIVIAYPDTKDTPDGEEIGFDEACRRVFTTFLKRAYRRPPTEEDVARIMQVCKAAKEAGFNYLEGIRYGVQATLVSPSFLFRSEPSPDDQPLDDYALATRLSYFLWSTMPDEELTRLADEGKLRGSEVLKEQVGRMLAHPRSKALVEGFFGQWLGLRNLSKIDIDRELYPLWSDRLREAMVKETEMFCEYLIQEGTIDDILSADFTFANARMADFYGIPFNKEGAEAEEGEGRRRFFQGRGRRGGERSFGNEDEWKKIALPEQRQGLITQAAVLALTSNPARTSPVKRGKWVLENVLGDPPPSAPPNVPSLESASAADDATLRERLEIHRDVPHCSGCHKILDPIGLGLENFDAIGRWRDSEDGHKLVVKGELVDGTTFESPKELVTILGKKLDLVQKNLTQRMMTYALGRGLQREDRCAIDQVIGYTDSHNRTVRSLIEGIVLSGTFQQTPTILPTPLGAPSDVEE